MPYEALKRGVTPDQIFEITKIDRWFTCKLRNLVDLERYLADGAETVSGLLLAIIASYPSSLSAQTQCTEQ